MTARCKHHRPHDWARDGDIETCQRCGRTRILLAGGGHLTPREAQISTYLQETPGVHRPREIVVAFGYQPTGRQSDSILVRKHIHNLRHKLPDPGCIQTIRGRGYRWRPS